MKLYHTTLGPIGTNCYIAADSEGNAAIVDPGASAKRVAELLDQYGLTPRIILLTHGHFDHIGGIKGLKAIYPGLQVAMGKKDVPMLARAPKQPMVTMYSVYEDYTDLSADIEVSEGDVLEAGSLRFSVLDTPGHTPGGVCYLCESYLFSGDTLFCGDVGRTDLEGGDYPSLMRSIKKLGMLPGDYTVLPGHEDISTLEDERQHNPYLQEAMTCF